MYSGYPIGAVFFDLDGTLLDTAPQLAAATNHVLAYHRRPTQHEASIRAQISQGTTGIIRSAFGLDPYKQYAQQLIQAYHMILNQTDSQKTSLFSGLRSTLTLLEKYGIPWGIVTNKPFWLAERVLHNLSFSYGPHCVIGGGSLLHQKPSPSPLLYASQLIGVPPEKSVYIGDAVTDIMAANAAKMYSVAAIYGYLSPEDQPQHWNADYILNKPSDLVDWLQLRIKKTS